MQKHSLALTSPFLLPVSLGHQQLPPPPAAAPTQANSSSWTQLTTYFVPQYLLQLNFALENFAFAISHMLTKAVK